MLEEESAMQGSTHTGVAPSERPDQAHAWNPEPPPALADLFSPSAMSRADRAACLARTLEHEIIPRLVEAHRSEVAGRASNDQLCGSIAHAEIERFAECLVRADELALAGTVSALRDRGFSIE
jgi:hypothetical protein